MKAFIIDKKSESSKLINFLKKLIPNAGVSFIYKMLRKKNITLNGKKAEGNEILKAKDEVKIYFSDDTFEKFASSEEKENDIAIKKLLPEEIVYEDDDILLVNKKAGDLSQKAAAGDISMVERVREYIGGCNVIKASCVNRLDRNTSGIVMFGKTAAGIKELSEALKRREIKKYYLCLVKGKITSGKLLNGLWSKDGRTNKVKIQPVETIKNSLSFPDKYWVKGNVPVQTLYAPIMTSEDVSLVKVELLTGKSHQIRAHMALAGHPLVGDFKYGDRFINDIFKKKYGLEFQLLHAYMVKIPTKGTFSADMPGRFKDILKGEGVWEPGIQEGFEGPDLKP